MITSGRQSILLVLFMSLAFWGLEAQQDRAFSLDEAILYAKENNRDIKLEFLNIADAEGQLLEYKSIGIPKIEGTVGYNYYIDLPTQIFPDVFSPAIYGILFAEEVIPERPIPSGMPSEVQFGTDHNLNAGIELNALLFDFAWLQGLKAQRLYRELIVRNSEQKAYEVRGMVTKAYLAVLIAQRNFELLDNNIRNLERLSTETRAIFEEGFAEKLDVDRLTLSLENLRTEQGNAERLVAITKNLLKFQMGYPIAQPITLTEEFEDLTAELRVQNLENASIDFNARPQYQALLLAEELNGLNQKVIKAGYLPTLRGFASYSQQLQRNDLFDGNESPWFPVSIVGLTLNVPIFDGLEKKAKLDRAKISLEKNQLQKTMFENAMTLEVENAKIQLENARQTVNSRERAMNLANEIYQTAQIKYREGVGSSLEMSQAESDYYNAQTQYINALYDLIVAKTELDIALGKI